MRLGKERKIEVVGNVTVLDFSYKGKIPRDRVQFKK